MKATAERMENNTVVMEVEIDAEKFNRAVNQAYKKLVKEVNVPGFRRGKAPRQVVETYIGKAALYSEAIDLVVPDAYVEAVDETGVEPIAQPEVELLHVEEGDPVKFKATVKVKPEVELGQYTGLEVAEVPAEVSDEDVDQGLEQLRQKHAQLVNVEDGAVQADDMVTIDFTGRADGKEFDGGSAVDYVLEVGSGSFIPGFEEQMEGMAPGETKTISVTFPEGYHSSDLAGKDAEFEVTIKSLKRKELAPLDDEFAKDVSEFDTLEELRTDVLNNLKQAAEGQAMKEKRNQAANLAVNNATVDLPEEMINDQIESMYQDMERSLMMQGLSLEDYLKYTKSNEDKVKEDFQPEAERVVKTMLVLDAIIKKEEIQFTDEDVEEKLKEMSARYQQTPEALKKVLEGQDQMKYVHQEIVREKAIDFLIENASIVQGTKETTEE